MRGVGGEEGEGAGVGIQGSRSEVGGVAAETVTR